MYQIQETELQRAPTVYIQTSVHGPETQGYAVILLLMEAFLKTPPQGNIIRVPYANPYGMNMKWGERTFGRFDPNTGDNWNRCHAKLTDLNGHAPINIKKFISLNEGVSLHALAPHFKKSMLQDLEQEMKKNVLYARKLNLQRQHLAVEADIVLDLQ